MNKDAYTKLESLSDFTERLPRFKEVLESIAARTSEPHAAICGHAAIILSNMRAATRRPLPGTRSSPDVSYNQLFFFSCFARFAAGVNQEDLVSAVRVLEVDGRAIVAGMKR